MKAVKILTVVCAVILFNGLFAISLLAQKTENDETTAVKATIQENESDDTTIPKVRRTDEKYRIGYQDTLEVVVNNHSNLSLLAVVVNSDGTIRMPKIDTPIVAACKTERELSETITQLYKSYLKNPFVNVRVIDQRSQVFAVIGAVEKPGSFYMNRRIRLLELLAFAGGPKIEKAGAKLQVARVGNVSGCVETQASEDEVVFLGFNVKDVMEGKENPWMQPGDIVSVLEAEEAYVVGNVIKPTKFSLKEPVTLSQAIAIGGGLAPEAKTSKVRIQRQESNSAVKTELVYDLKDIVSKKIPDPVLQANDIVEVPKDGVKSARNGIIKALTNGIPGLFYGL